MEIVDRYLKTVGNYLPKEQKDDILRELSENIRSEVEDREKELGRPLTVAEQEAIVKAQGNPLVVAGRYRQEKRTVAFGRQWIGPELFPLYLKMLTFNLGISVGDYRGAFCGAGGVWTERYTVGIDDGDFLAGVDSGRNCYGDF